MQVEQEPHPKKTRIKIGLFGPRIPVNKTSGYTYNGLIYPSEDKEGRKPISWPFKKMLRQITRKIEDIISFNNWIPLPNLLTPSSISCN